MRGSWKSAIGGAIGDNAPCLLEILQPIMIEWRCRKREKNNCFCCCFKMCVQQRFLNKLCNDILEYDLFGSDQVSTISALEPGKSPGLGTNMYEIGLTSRKDDILC